MKKILFVHQLKAHLPELDAYSNFFRKYGFETEELSYKDLTSIDEKEMKKTILWYFMGLYIKKSIFTPFLTIHDYRSLSVGMFARVKDKIKKHMNFKPDIRVFLNDYVKESLNFNDSTPSFMIDMGLPSSIVHFIEQPVNPEFDFIYSGVISNERKIDKLIDRFLHTYGKTKSLLLVGLYNPKIKERYEKFNNILFTGKVSQKEVFRLVKKSHFAISAIPNKYPYNVQTPTKLLEYLALRSRVIMSNSWIARKILYETDNHDRVFIMDNEWNFPSENELEAIKPTSLNVDDYLWDKIIERSNLLESIKQRL
ncbi:MAG: hypothetical protein QJR05_13940 [Thermoanaerobacterium sp.]|nr:hypothetical protein [Thermoanaerobacterium sp.]